MKPMVLFHNGRYALSLREGTTAISLHPASNLQIHKGYPGRQDTGENMPHIHVTCAIIERNGLVLAARRSASMHLPLKWEFPGGKIRVGEDPAQCLKREILEELALEVDIAAEMPLSTHNYPEFIVTLYPYVCRTSSYQFSLLEHAEAAWFPPDRLAGLDWAEADLPVLNAYLSLRSEESI